MSVLHRLPRLRSSDEFLQAVYDTDGEIVAAEAKLEALAESRRASLFDPALTDRDREKIRADIRDTEDLIVRLTEGRQGAKDRYDQAVYRERIANVERTMEAARADRMEMIKDYANLHAAGKAFADAAMSVRKRKLRLIEANNAAREAGRGDLQVAEPITQLGERLGRQIFDPAESVTLRDYLPAHPDGPPLDHLDLISDAKDHE